MKVSDRIYKKALKKEAESDRLNVCVENNVCPICGGYLEEYVDYFGSCREVTYKCQYCSFKIE